MICRGKAQRRRARPWPSVAAAYSTRGAQHTHVVNKPSPRYTSSGHRMAGHQDRMHGSHAQARIEPPNTYVKKSAGGGATATAQRYYRALARRSKGQKHWQPPLQTLALPAKRMVFANAEMYKIMHALQQEARRARRHGASLRRLPYVQQISV